MEMVPFDQPNLMIRLMVVVLGSLDLRHVPPRISSRDAIGVGDNNLNFTSKGQGPVPQFDTHGRPKTGLVASLETDIDRPDGEGRFSSAGD